MLHAFGGHISDIQNGELRENAVRLEFFERRDKSRVLLNNVDEPNFFADHTVVIAHGCQRKMNAVRQSGAVDEDACILFPYGFQQVADTLRGEVCFWIKNPGEASLIPSDCVQINSFLKDVIQKHRAMGIRIPISQ